MLGSTDYASWVDIAERLGIPTAVLLIFMYFAFRGILWFAKNILQPLTKSHMALVDEVKEANKENTKALAKNAETLEKMGDAYTKLASIRANNE